MSFNESFLEKPFFRWDLLYAQPRPLPKQITCRKKQCEKMLHAAGILVVWHNPDADARLLVRSVWMFQYQAQWIGLFGGVSVTGFN